MEAPLERKKPHNIEHLSEKRLDEIEGFVKKVLEKHRDVIASVLVRRPSEERSSIDVVLVLDDINSLVFDQHAETVKMDASEMAYSSELPIRCEVTLTSAVWDGLKSRMSQCCSSLGIPW